MTASKEEFNKELVGKAWEHKQIWYEFPMTQNVFWVPYRINGHILPPLKSFNLQSFYTTGGGHSVLREWESSSSTEGSFSFALYHLNWGHHWLLIVLWVQCGNLPKKTGVGGISSLHTSWPYMGSRLEAMKGNEESWIFPPVIQNN